MIHLVRNECVKWILQVVVMEENSMIESRTECNFHFIDLRDL